MRIGLNHAPNKGIVDFSQRFFLWVRININQKENFGEQSVRRNSKRFLEAVLYLMQTGFMRDRTYWRGSPFAGGAVDLELSLNCALA
jgi:hypothetical protein